MINPRIFHLSLINWLASLEPTLCLTHNFGYRVTMQTGVRSLKNFYNRLQRCVHGRNWNKRVTDQPMIGVGVWEHLDSNVHCHVLLAASDEESSWLFDEGDGLLAAAAAARAVGFFEDRVSAKGHFIQHEGDLCAELARPAVRLQSAAFQDVGRLAA